MPVNAFVPHAFAGEVFTVLVGAVCLDKGPDQAKQRPRPAWAVVDGLFRSDAIQTALTAMLESAPNLRCIMRETYAPGGDPTGGKATRWLNAPVET